MQNYQQMIFKTTKKLSRFHLFIFVSATPE